MKGSFIAARELQEIACSDSRVSPEIFDQGDIFVIRTAGNVVDSIALDSIECVEHFHTPLPVLGHQS